MKAASKKPRKKQPLQVEEGLHLDELRTAIRREYEAVACDPGRGFHFHTGRRLTTMLGYEPEWLDSIPESTIASFAGTGNPFAIAPIWSGERVVDVGCGAGMDSMIAAQMVGPEGRVIGVDMTPEMIDKARMGTPSEVSDHLDFRQGYAEELPVPDEWADVVISNGVINLTPDKSAVFTEMARALKPGGRLQIADIIVDRPVPLESKQQADLWTGCIAGALLEEELRMIVTGAGFVDFDITWSADVYEGAPQSSSARNFGTMGINFHARKAVDAGDWNREMDAIPLLY
ncbi:MAG: methyltransferase domain-containing protein [Balneolaceae bacterium]|nr:methyltransferase domain-containing protein [Balneolaceae bacterium]